MNTENTINVGPTSAPLNVINEATRLAKTLGEVRDKNYNKWNSTEPERLRKEATYAVHAAFRMGRAHPDLVRRLLEDGKTILLFRAPNPESWSRISDEIIDEVHIVGLRAGLAAGAYPPSHQFSLPSDVRSRLLAAGYTVD